MINLLSKTYGFIKMINLIIKTYDFMNMINFLRKMLWLIFSLNYRNANFLSCLRIFFFARIIEKTVVI